METRSIKGKSTEEINAALLDTMRDLSGKLELTHLLASVLERAVTLLDLTGGELAIYHEEHKYLEVVASHNLGMNSIGVHLNHGEGAMGRVSETLKPLIITDYQNWDGRSDQYTKTTIQSVIVVPLLIGNQLVGVLGVYLEEHRQFDDDDLKLLNMFAPLAATAIENARLFEAERRRADEQKALLETMTDLSRKLELNHLLSSVLERAVFLLKVTGGELAIYHEDRKELEVVASHNLGVNSKGVRLKHGEGVMGRVAETQKPVIITDYQTWEGRSDKYAKTTVRSVIMVPLLIGNQLVGALGGVHLEANRHFDNKDLQLLNMFAPLAATAIENARLFDKTTRLLEEAEHRATELKRTQDHLIRQEKLASLGELTAGIAHEIQNPLNFVNNFSEVSNELLDEMKSELEAGNWKPATEIARDVKQNLEKILHHGKRADAIVKGMLQHSRKSSGQKELTDINELCDEYLRLSYHGLRAKDRSFNAKFESNFDPTLPKINVVPQDIGRVVLNLINNAFYAVNEKKNQNPVNYEPTVIVSTKRVGAPLGVGGAGMIEVLVSDNGHGIPPHIKDKIFQPFFTTKPTGQGTGLGLSLSYDIVKAHGGELTVETSEGTGSIFTIILNAS